MTEGTSDAGDVDPCSPRYRQDQVGGREPRTAPAAAAARDLDGTPSLRRTAETWWPTVRCDRVSRAAISASERPSTRWLRMSSSRAVSPAALVRAAPRGPRGTGQPATRPVAPHGLGAGRCSQTQQSRDRVGGLRRRAARESESGPERPADRRPGGAGLPCAAVAHQGERLRQLERHVVARPAQPAPPGQLGDDPWLPARVRRPDVVGDGDDLLGPTGCPRGLGREQGHRQQSLRLGCPLGEQLQLGQQFASRLGVARTHGCCRQSSAAPGPGSPRIRADGAASRRPGATPRRCCPARAAPGRAGPACTATRRSRSRSAQ